MGVCMAAQPYENVQLVEDLQPAESANPQYGGGYGGYGGYGGKCVKICI